MSRALLFAVVLAVGGIVLGWYCIRMMPQPISEPLRRTQLNPPNPWIERASPEQESPRRNVASKSVVQSDQKTAQTNGLDAMEYWPAQPPSDFGGFVPSVVKSLAAGLQSTYHRCHTPGALCGHASYVDLIPNIMADSNHDADSWAAQMEQLFKAHFEETLSDVRVEQIHCSDSGCLIDLTQEKTDRTLQEQRAVYREARNSLTNEPWLKQQFFATYEDSPFTGAVSVSDDQNRSEDLWVFARKVDAEPASAP
jgi:hypothetical protein